jgi:hypothetical protein
MQEMLKRPLYSSSSSLQADSFSITATDMNLSLALLQKILYAPQLGACYGSRTDVSDRQVMRKSLSQARWRRPILANRLLSGGPVVYPAPHLPKMAMLDVWLTFPIIIKKSGISTSLMKGIVAGSNTSDPITRSCCHAVSQGFLNLRSVGLSVHTHT